MKRPILPSCVPVTPISAGEPQVRTLTPTKEPGFTIVELIVVVTIISILASLALGAYNKVLNDTKLAKANALVSTLMTAKTAFLADSSTSAAAIQQFNTAPDANFASIAPYIRINGAQPANEDDLRKLIGLPSSTSIALGTVDDAELGGRNADQAPAVMLHKRPS
jgi:type IV pilus assembly protein PilE